MGAGQIGGIATLLDIDFKNAAGFLGVGPESSEGQFIVHYFSHAMMFCVGALIEAHVVLTPALCILGERFKFEVYGGTHSFLERKGASRVVEHIGFHRGFNRTLQGGVGHHRVPCSPDNLALLVLDKQFSFHDRERGADFVMNRVRYGRPNLKDDMRYKDRSCAYFGWGSRRNGYLVPLLINLRRMPVTILPPEKCDPMWNHCGKFLCIQQETCKSSKFGALCPDDVGSVIVCSGFAQGMMISRLVDRPCGVGFLDLNFYQKFMTCGVDDSRDITLQDDYLIFDYISNEPPTTPSLATASTTPEGKEVTEITETTKKSDVTEDKGAKIESESKDDEDDEEGATAEEK